MKETDLLIDPQTGDLQASLERDACGLIIHGLEVGDTTYQNQAVILQANKGELKEYPTLGIGISAMVNDHQDVGWAREISLQLKADGMKVNDVKIDITNNKLTIDAGYDS